MNISFKLQILIVSIFSSTIASELASPLQLLSATKNKLINEIENLKAQYDETSDLIVSYEQELEAIRELLSIKKKQLKKNQEKIDAEYLRMQKARQVIGAK